MKLTMALLLSVLLLPTGGQAEDDRLQTNSYYLKAVANDVMFKHEIMVVKGTVWMFNEDGKRAQYHGPVGWIRDSNTYAISVSPIKVDINNPTQIEELLTVARKFCEDTGYVREIVSNPILVGERSALIVEFCFPPDVSWQPSPKIGDRVPRQ
jgi:hypothetical protein